MTQANAEDRALIEVKRRALMAQLYRDTGVAKLPGVGDFLDKFLLPPVAATASVASTAIMSSSSRRGTVVVDSSDEDDVIPPSPARRGKRSAIVPSKVIKKRAFALMSDDEDEDEDEDEPKGSATRRAGGESVELQCLQCNGSLLAKTVSGLCEECDAAAFASVFTCQKAAPVASVPSTCAAGSGSDEVVVISDDVPDPVVTITSVKDSLPQGMQAASKIIMFGHHRDVLDGVEAEVRSRGYQCIRYRTMSFVFLTHAVLIVDFVSESMVAPLLVSSKRMYNGFRTTLSVKSPLLVSQLLGLGSPSRPPLRACLWNCIGTQARSIKQRIVSIGSVSKPQQFR